jgi:hypothetical protein
MQYNFNEVHVTDCVSKVSSENTVGLFSVNDPLHGLCKNTEPISNFTECVGNCETKTRYVGRFLNYILLTKVAHWPPKDKRSF